MSSRDRFPLKPSMQIFTISKWKSQPHATFGSPQDQLPGTADEYDASDADDFASGGDGGAG